MKNEQKTEAFVCENCGVKAARLIKRPQVLGRGTKMILVDNVPVITCKNCGENYMTSETMHRLDDIRLKQKAQNIERKIAVLNLLENSKLCAIGEGTSEIQPLVIAKQLLKA